MHGVKEKSQNTNFGDTAEIQEPQRREITKINTKLYP